MLNTPDLSRMLGISVSQCEQLIDPSNIDVLQLVRDLMQSHTRQKFIVDNPQGIEELVSVPIGGIDQGLHIRGRNRDNPILLYLHGGPGCPWIGFMDAIQRPWEDYFTVVQWDQRQTGKSYYPADDDNNPLTVAQFIHDTEEVVQYLLDHLMKDKLFLLGHSWGSILGTHIAKQHPDCLHAYIGVGQVVNMWESEQLLFQRLYQHAEARQERALINKLDAIGPYPDVLQPGQSFIEHAAFLRKEIGRLAGESLMHHTSWEDFGRMLNFERTISPHLTWVDMANRVFGDKDAVERAPYSFAKEFLQVDLPVQVGSEFEVPVFFFTGAHDHQTSVTLSDKWFSSLQAPYKELVHFDDSAHMVVNEEPGKFLIELVNKVLPYASANTLIGTEE